MNVSIFHLPLYFISLTVMGGRRKVAERRQAFIYAAFRGSWVGFELRWKWHTRYFEIHIEWSSHTQMCACVSLHACEKKRAFMNPFLVFIHNNFVCRCLHSLQPLSIWCNSLARRSECSAWLFLLSAISLLLP